MAVSPALADVAVLDGGLASELEMRGYDLSGDLWSARLLREAPDAVRDVHTTYFTVGAGVGISASYQASRAGFERAGMTAAEADRMLQLSVRLVHEARERARERGAAHPMLVAASVGPFGAVRHDGSEYRGRYGIAQRRLVDFHAERIAVLLSGDPDLLAIETVPDLVEAEAVVSALALVGVSRPAWLSFSCADEETTNAGQPIEEAAALVAGAGLAAVGVNCTAPRHVAGLVRRIRAAEPDLPIVVYPNAGRTWDAQVGEWRGAGADTIPADTVTAWRRAGADLVGGCCGLGPAAIAALTR